MFTNQILVYIADFKREGSWRHVRLWFLPGRGTVLGLRHADLLGTVRHANTGTFGGCESSWSGIVPSTVRANHFESKCPGSESWLALYGFFVFGRQ